MFKLIFLFYFHIQFYFFRVVLGLANALAILTIISERNGGVWERTIVSGVKPVEILIVHMITLCFTSAIQTLECFLVPQFVFGLECKGNIFEGLLLVYSQAVVGVALGNYSNRTFGKKKPVSY